MKSFVVAHAAVILLLASWAAGQTEDTAPATHRHVRHVITNDDIPPSPEADPVLPKGQKAGKGSSAAVHTAGNQLDKAGLSNSDGDVKEAIQQLKRREAALEEKLNRLKERMQNEDDDFRRQMWADALENQKATLEQFRKVRERLEREEQSDKDKPAPPSASGS